MKLLPVSRETCTPRHSFSAGYSNELFLGAHLSGPSNSGTRRSAIACQALTFGFDAGFHRLAQGLARFSTSPQLEAE